MSHWIALALVALLVAAASATAAATSPQAQPYKGLTLTVWIDHQADAYTNLFNAFTKATGAKFDLQVYQNQQVKWVAGARPDLMMDFGSSADTKRIGTKDILPLDNVSGVKNSLVTIPVVDGHKYFVPLEYPALWGIIYNRSVFKQLGVALPKSLADVMSTCKAIKAKSSTISPLYEAVADKWPTQIMAFYQEIGDVMKGTNWMKRVLAKQVSWSDPYITQRLARYPALIKAGCYQDNFTSGTYEGEQKAIATGTTAMVAMPTSFIVPSLQATYGTSVVNNLGFIPLSPNGHNFQYSLQKSGTFYVPRTGNKKKQAASLAFIKFATGPAYQKLVNDLNSLPSITGFKAPKNAPAILLEEKKWLESGKGWNGETLQPFPWLGAPVENGSAQLALGQISPEQFGQNLQQAFAQAAQAARYPGW